MKKWLVGLTEKNLSKLPLAVAIVFPVIGLCAILTMLGLLSLTAILPLSEYVPVWILQIAVMSPWIGFIGLIILAIAAVVSFILFDISVHKNAEVYKREARELLGFDNSSNTELKNEIFNS